MKILFNNLLLISIFYFCQLVEKCDVLLENYLPGKLAKIGLGYERLKVLSPRLIYCSISGYGQSGPYTRKGGYDVIAAAVGGLMHITGPEVGENTLLSPII